MRRTAISTRDTGFSLVVMSGEAAAAAVLPFRAVITGGTGAIGKCLVGELLASRWERVTVIGRSDRPRARAFATRF